MSNSPPIRLQYAFKGWFTTAITGNTILYTKWKPIRDFTNLRAAGNSSPKGSWSDGTTRWVADYEDDKIYAYRMRTKQRTP